jgi:ATP-dependent Clp protease protease subunit
MKMKSSPLFLSERFRRIFCAGRVLSSENEAKIRAARDGLDEVLSKLADTQESDNLRRTFNRGALSPGVLRLAADEEKKEAEVFVYGDIGGWFDGVTAEDFAKEVAGLDVDSITVQLNSGGGVVFDGVAIYNALAQHKAKVVVNITGIASSIASVIAMAGDEIRIAEGAHVMIHKPWSFAIGDAEDMRKEAEVLDKLESGIIDIYEARTGKDRKQLEDWVAAETWFKGQEAVDAGFADEMVPAKKKEKKAAKSNLFNLFRNAPKDILPEGDNIPVIREFERLLKEGEGFSNSQARRIAALATRMHREDSTGTLRDEGGQITASDIRRLANFIKTLR